LQKKISLTNRVIKKKVVSIVKIKTKTKIPVSADIVIKPENNVALIVSDVDDSFNKSKKSPRELAISFQAEMRNLKDKLSK
tara:strand:+ start:291 stop:533 length:243 start_codon:yes stop_codon:yes gene_type:complete